MRTKIIEKKLYKFEELTPESQEMAIDNLGGINVEDGFWHECTYEDAENVGFKITEFDLGRSYHLKGKFIESARECAELILKEHGDTCETYKTAENFLKERDGIIDQAPRDENGDFENEYEVDNKLDDLEEEFKKSLQEDYRIMLEKEYEYLTSSEAIKETILANEYEFNEQGRIDS